MSFTSKFGERPAHPEWLDAAYRNLAHIMELHSVGRIPSSIEVAMIVTPMRRMLRCIYGSNWAAVIALARDAAGSSWQHFKDTLWRFWRYRVRLCSPEADMNAIDDNEEEG